MTTRCIVHIDMDCFYAQVEAVRLGVECREVPFILSQWNNLIAVNYPAREKGIARFCTVQEAREKCPEVQVGIVPTYKVGETCYRYHYDARRNTHKVALEPYRDASRKIFDILHNFPYITVEKASVDEAFVDATEAAKEELNKIALQFPADYRLDPEKDVLDPSTKVLQDQSDAIEKFLRAQGTSTEEVYDRPMQTLKRSSHPHKEPGSTSFHIHSNSTAEEQEDFYQNCLLLAATSVIVKRIRDKIYADLKYDCSAGIAHNRLLAKSISSIHKPRQQTLLFPDRVLSALFNVKVEKLRGFGGKFGRAVAAATRGATSCPEAWLVPLPSFYYLDGLTRDAEEEEEDGDGKGNGRRGGVKRPRQEKIGPTRVHGEVDVYDDWTHHETALFAYYRIRGYGDDTVSSRVIVKSLMASKNFRPPTRDIEGIRKWLVVLSTELSARYQEFLQTNGISGRNLNLKLGSGGQFSAICNRTAPLPDPVTQESLYNVALHETQFALHAYTAAHGGEPVLVNFVTLTIGNLTGKGGSSAGQHTLTDMFARNLCIRAFSDKEERQAKKRLAAREENKEEEIISDNDNEDEEEEHRTAGAKKGTEGCDMVNSDGDMSVYEIEDDCCEGESEVKETKTVKCEPKKNILEILSAASQRGKKHTSSITAPVIDLVEDSDSDCENNKSDDDDIIVID